MADLEQALMRTVLWFSLFERSLTEEELWMWMIRTPDQASRTAVGPAIDQLVARRALKREGAYVSLPSSHDPASVRDERARDAIRKFRKLRRVVNVLRWVPGVRGIAAANTLAFSHTRPDSDIDLFVVVRPGTIWATRLLCVVPFIVLGARPGNREQDPFCFSFFAAENALDLSALQLPEGDPYLAVWVRSLVPVYDAGGIFEQFHAANAWAKTLVPQAGGRVSHSRMSASPRSASLPGIPEGLARRVQLPRLPERVREMMNKDTRVIVNDQYLKFHDTDRRAEYRDRWMDLCRTHGCL